MDEFEKEGDDGNDRMSARSPDSDISRETEATDERAESAVTDPVRETFSGELDLYEIATWEPRSVFDTAVVAMVRSVGRRKRDLLIALALTLFLGQVLVAGIFVLEAPILGLLSVLSIVPALALVVTIWSSDPTTREPISLLGVTFVLAALFASFAAVINSVFLPGFEAIPVLGLPLFYFLVVGPIEEFVKWLAIRVHAYHSRQFKTVVDGVVYGAVAGLGFAAIENLSYIVYFSVTVTPLETVIEQPSAIGIAVTRSFVGPGHVVFSAWAGFYLGLAKFNPEHRVPIVVKGILVAAFIHALYNTVVSTVPMTTSGFLLFVTGYLLFWFALLSVKISRYRELYRAVAENTPAESPPHDRSMDEGRQ